MGRVVVMRWGWVLKTRRIVVRYHMYLGIGVCFFGRCGFSGRDVVWVYLCRHFSNSTFGERSGIRSMVCACGGPFPGDSGIAVRRNGWLLLGCE